MSSSPHSSCGRWLCGVAAGALVLGAGLSAHAQNVAQALPPEHYTLDARGVDLVTGTFNYETASVVIGDPAAGGLVYSRGRVNLGWRDSRQGSISIAGSTYSVAYGLKLEVFTLSGSTFTPQSTNGSSLTQSGTTLTFTTSDGTVVKYTTDYCFTPTGKSCTNRAALYETVEPNGVVTKYHYVTKNYVRSIDPISGDPVIGTVARLQSVTNSNGYQLHYKYKGETVGGNLNTTIWNWLAVDTVTGVNNAIDYCAPTASSCTFTQAWPSISYASVVGGPVTSETDQSGRVTQYMFGSSGDLTGIRYPGSTSNDVTLDESGATSRVTSLTDASGTWNYAYSDSGTTRTTTATGPLGLSLTVVSDLTIGRAKSVKDALNRTTTYAYDAQRRLQRVTRPEGDYTQLTYDARGNVTQTLSVAKPGSGLPNITTSTAYPPTCTNPVTCNQPTSATDALGGVTNYTYDAVHGGVLTVTEPAPTTGAARPQTRITYAPQTARYKNASGVLAAAPTAVTLPTSISACVTGTTCAGTANEVKTSIVYGTAGAANNLLPTSVTTGAGDGSLTATTAMTYTPTGDVATIDSPMAGVADTTTYRYDNARQLVGVIGPDPDGAGPLLRRAQRATYNPRGQVTLTEAGTVTGLTDANWAAFVSLQKVAASYDAYGRPTHQRQQSGSTTHALTQFSYDAAGRIDCTTTRMNPATFASPPAAACTAATSGTFGPDRISKNGYDVAGQLISTTTGLGVDAITENATYNANGQPLTLSDGKNNLSTIVYDGFGRPVKMLYPNPASSGSSTTDYEEYTYSAAGNVLTYRNRGGNTFTSGYDALGRQTSLTGGGMPARNFTYDNLGRTTSAAITGGASLTRTWDALGRMTSETQNPLGKTVAYQYDLAGRRTRLTWPDGFFVNYDYNVGGDLTAIRENGATDWQLTSWAHDNLGRRTTQARANGATTAWLYDGASRLISLSHDLPGTANDLGLTFTYNPASQIASRTMSNTAYAYAPAAGATSYVNNGKNQVTSVGGSAVSYDARQNIASAPMGSYVYDGLNQMTSATVSGAATTFTYDPAGRMVQMGATRLLHDGARPMGEYDAAGNVLRRYVPGLSMDETVTAYEGAGPTDRRWLLADERLSVAAYTNGTGGILSRNTYDEYGQPGAGNAGLFQYTGQIWLPQAQLYHYKARTYAPQMGRFMQTDPIGYVAGANLYAYVGADPVNLNDPSGLMPAARVCSSGAGKPYISPDGTPSPGDVWSTCSVGTSGSQPNFRERNLPRTGERSEGSKSCDAPLSSFVGSARAVLETTATGADILTVGLAAGGVTGPVAVGTKVFGIVVEAGLGAVNAYDAYANGNYGPLEAQGASLGARLIPGGRAFQSALKAGRGPTGILRNSRGQFRSSHLNNPAFEEAGNILTQRTAGSTVEMMMCP